MRSAARATVLLESLVEHTEERLLLGGTANLTRNTADFGGFAAIDPGSTRRQGRRLAAAGRPQQAGKVTVRIGHETEAEQMMGTSVVSTTLRHPRHRLRRHGRARAYPNGLSGNYR